jgi:hypothetical protein
VGADLVVTCLNCGKYIRIPLKCFLSF